LERAEDVPLAVTGGQDTIGLRVPNHPLALQLLTSFGAGVAAPSANRFGAVSPTTAAHVRADLGDEVDCLIDGGPCEIGVESTILDLSRDRPRLLRPGGVSLEALESVLGERVNLDSSGEVRAPGQLASHYAPRAELLLLAGPELEARVSGLQARGARVGVLAPEGTPLPAGLEDVVVLPRAAATYAKALYSSLRELDARGIDVLLAVAPEEPGLGMAVRDRLERAAGPRTS
jgi:L-threonylcarbamoyladenylate synthase